MPEYKLIEKKCENPRCNNTFKTLRNTQKYCSIQCTETYVVFGKRLIRKNPQIQKSDFNPCKYIT